MILYLLLAFDSQETKKKKMAKNRAVRSHVEREDEEQTNKREAVHSKATRK